jgi:hypothetical protein
MGCDIATSRGAVSIGRRISVSDGAKRLASSTGNRELSFVPD